VGIGPGKKELLLRIVQCLAEKIGNWKFLTETLSNILRVEEFINRQPHFKGQKVFGLKKRKANMLLGCEFDFHRLNKVNFSHPCIQTRASRATTSAPKLNPILEEIVATMDVEIDDTIKTKDHLGELNTYEWTHVSMI